jgi:hypothetical protein
MRADTNEYIKPMDYLRLVPKYVVALKHARFGSSVANAMMKNINTQPTDSKTVDLPKSTEETKPPE